MNNDSIQTEHGEFYPIINIETGEVIKTAEEYYQEWLANLANPPDNPTNQIGILQQQVQQLTEEKLILAQNVLELTNVVEAIVLGGTT